MKKYELIILLSSCLLWLVSCSSTEQKSLEPTKKVYSRSTEKEFEDIEKYDFGNKTNYRPATTGKSRNAPGMAPLKNHPKEVITETPPEKYGSGNAELQAPTQLSAKNEERLQEINQNLAFFCMKHRQDPAFKNEENCLAFTKKVLKSCEKKHQIINTVMVNCIKERLKKKR